MKKIFFLTFSLLVTAFAYQSCKPVDNTRAIMESDSIANARLLMFNDSLKMACMSDVLAAAKMRADSMMAMKSHGSSKGSKPKPPAPPAKKPGVSDRPGAEQPKSISDRKGTTDSTHGPKKISDRKGVSAPPK